MYVTDAYHSLSIEGYRVSPALIERVRTGNWNPDDDERDREHSNGLAARTTHLRSMIAGAEIACAPRTQDRYGRTVAVCRTGTTDLGAAMVRDGWAMAFVRYSADYVAAEREARESRRGMWAGSLHAAMGMAGGAAPPAPARPSKRPASPWG